MEQNECTVAIIAGGKSRRFGRPKYQAQIAGRRLIDFALDVALQLSPEVLIVSGLESIKNAFDLPVFDDEFPNCGPLGGIHAALKRMRTKWLAVLPVDMPLLKAEIYHELLKHRGGKGPVVAKTSKGVEPMVSLWPRSALDVIEHALQTKQFKIHDVLDSLAATEVPFPPDESIHFFNVNFESDLRLIAKVLAEKEK